ncbi:MAG: radical SAM family heme chaperone HemW, partial [Bdellovibrionaceae bacterium]|nr:radical SAM family heme chaperone HemW [Pseudobdellovibrionaceae bacterium]
MAFGVYVHVPYCIQRCSYCDFATYEQYSIMPPPQYFSLLWEEIVRKSSLFPQKKLDTLYFGGGTPSLVDPSLIAGTIKILGDCGFPVGPDTEVTMEVNPATLTPQKMEFYLDIGVNRFSVGAQTFKDSLLKMVKREHSSADTIETLRLLQKYEVNFSFDLLFALPEQTFDDLLYDLKMAIDFAPSHISPYCLTLNDTHPLNKGRPLDDVQVEMFHLISETLTSAGYRRYEISNFCLPQRESRHNMLYWTDQEYWGVGLSAHSYRHNSA